MYHEVDLHRRSEGRNAVVRVPNSIGRLNINDLTADLRENCDGLCEIGSYPFPPNGEDIRSYVLKKLEPILCYDVPGKGVHYTGMKYVTALSLRLVSNREQ